MEKMQFKAESARLLDLMINSIYTHKEIFLREIISNASDAIDKLAYTALTDDKVGLNRDDFAITITRAPEARILTVSDNGIGMNRAEMEENLGTIAKSGSLGFKQAMEKNEDIDIIGQFGVGFYSAFMVASSVTVISKKYGEDTAWKWTSDGTDGYTIEEAEREFPGTDVIMTIKEDTEDDKYSEFLEEYQIRSLVRKYSDYIRYPIRMEVSKSRKKEESNDYESYMEEETLNSMIPLWQRAKKDVTETEYESFYRERFFDFNKPARTIHFSTEGTVSFKALLYIPAKAPFDFYSKDFKQGLQLYSSGVMIMEFCEELLPEHFRFVRGVVDSQDLSLNISREMLQHNRQLTVIARSIEKKIKGELKQMLENDRENFEKFYGVFGRQLKYGAVSDYGTHKEATQDLLLFYSHKQGKLVTLQEYVDAMAEGQEKIYFAPGENTDRLAKLPQVKALSDKGYDVLLFGDEVDEFVPQSLMTYAEKSFCNVTTEDLQLQTEEEKKELEAKAEEMKGFLTFVKDSLGERVKEVRLSGNLGTAPVAMIPDSGMSFEMEKYMKRVNPEFTFSAGRILELNPEHAAVKAMLSAVTEDAVKAKDYAELLMYQAQLMAELPLDDPAAYTELVCKLMK
ncbi:MAG: molecular chaperone HtpG [Oscillospiraceae bacterium]|nr:molecular chaperone HtpG [Oscillospiraceae bacterium]